MQGLFCFPCCAFPACMALPGCCRFLQLQLLPTTSQPNQLGLQRPAARDMCSLLAALSCAFPAQQPPHQVNRHPCHPAWPEPPSFLGPTAPFVQLNPHLYYRKWCYVEEIIYIPCDRKHKVGGSCLVFFRCSPSGAEGRLNLRGIEQGGRRAELARDEPACSALSSVPPPHPPPCTNRLLPQPPPPSPP